MGWPNNKGLPPHNANTSGNLEFAPGIREFAQNTLLGENDQIWQPRPHKGLKYQKRTGTSDVIFKLTRSVYYTNGSSSIGKKKCFFKCLYRSPSQTSDEFEDFCRDLNLFLLNINELNPACSIITDDFNARSPQWWALDKKNNEGREISFLISSAGYS